MKGKILISLMVGLVVTLWAVTALAQAEERKAQLFFVEDVVVKPSMAAEYEAVMKEVVTLCTKHKFPYPFYAYSTDDFHYYFVYPVENFADIDNLYKAFGELGKKMGAEQWQGLMKRFAGTFEYYQYSVIRYLLEFSYTPEKSRLKPEEENFVFWEFFYIPFGKEIEFAEICQEWVELYKSKNIPDGWSTYVGDIGTEIPTYIVVLWGKSAADYFSQLEKTVELLGEEGQALVKKTMDLCRRYETKTGMRRPDLSYTPKEE